MALMPVPTHVGCVCVCGLVWKSMRQAIRENAPTRRAAHTLFYWGGTLSRERHFETEGGGGGRAEERSVRRNP